jgi:hypothetical protein
MRLAWSIPLRARGLYYAIRSGDLAGQIILDHHHAAERKPAAYSALLRQDFLADLEYGSTLSKRFFTGRFLFSGATTRMVDFMKRSPRFHDLMQDLFARNPGLPRSEASPLQPVAVHPSRSHGEQFPASYRGRVTRSQSALPQARSQELLHRAQQIIPEE